MFQVEEVHEHIYSFFENIYVRLSVRFKHQQKFSFFSNPLSKFQNQICGISCPCTTFHEKKKEKKRKKSQNPIFFQLSRQSTDWLTILVWPESPRLPWRPVDFPSVILANSSSWKLIKDVFVSIRKFRENFIKLTSFFCDYFNEISCKKMSLKNSELLPISWWGR